LDWSNFLLACVNCNSCKGDDDIQLDDHVWPHIDNTLRAIDWTRGYVKPKSGLPTDVQQKAQLLIRLVGLDIDPGNPVRQRRPDHSSREKDDRYDRRAEYWASANRSRKRLEMSDTPEMREEIVERARDKGFFSIWYAVFADDRDMRLRLIRSFLGTAQDCFDPDGLPISSPRGCC
jgi:hypothetical protein